MAEETKAANALGDQTTMQGDRSVTVIGGDQPTTSISALTALSNLHAGPEISSDKPVYGRIITGMRLSVAAQKRIATCFEKKLGVPVKLVCRVDEREMAGVRVELGGYSYDDTVRGQLHQLQKYLIETNEEGSGHE